MAQYAKTRSSTRPSKLRRSRVRRCTLWACCPTAACTPATSTCSRSFAMPCEAACPTCACMRLWTAATFLLPAEKTTWPSLSRSSKATDSLMRCASQAFRGAIAPWTATSAGSACRKRTKPWWKARPNQAHRALLRPCRLLTTKVSRMNSSFPSLSTSAACRKAMPSSSSTSGPTAHASSHARSSTSRLTGSTAVRIRA